MKATNKFLTIVFLPIFFCLSPSSASAIEKKKDSIINILFVGNSLTYYNNLPSLVVQLEKRKNITINTNMLAFPDYALEDHWHEGKFQRELASRQYDFVVVQQGPSSQKEGRAMLLDYGIKMKAECEKYNSKLAFYMVWPAFANLNSFDGVIKNYRDAASTTNSLLCPVGEIWKKKFDATKNYSYYGPDKFHPSKEGSEVAARVIYESLFPEEILK